MLARLPELAAAVERKIAIHLAWIEAAPPRGGGRGEKMLAQLLALADEHGVTFTLMVRGSADPDDANAVRLTAWYERNGFVGRPGAIMRRVPRPPTPK